MRKSNLRALNFLMIPAVALLLGMLATPQNSSAQPQLCIDGTGVADPTNDCPEIPAACTNTILTPEDPALCDGKICREVFGKFPFGGFFPQSCPTGVGPIGMLFMPNGDVLVSTPLLFGHIFVHSLTPDCLSGVSPGPRRFLAMDFALSLDGRVFSTDLRSAGNFLEYENVFPYSLIAIHRMPFGTSSQRGITRNPRTGELIIAVGTPFPGGLLSFDPMTNTFDTVILDDVFFGPDGVVATIIDGDIHYFVANFFRNNVVEVVDNGVDDPFVDRVWDFPLNSFPDGAALGRKGSCLDGSMFVARNDGIISRIDLSKPVDDPLAIRDFGVGNTRHDFVKVPSANVEGVGFTMFVTATDRIEMFRPGNFEPTPGASLAPAEFVPDFICDLADRGCLGGGPMSANANAKAQGAAGQGACGQFTGLTMHLLMAQKLIEDGKTNIMGICNHLQQALNWVNNPAHDNFFTCPSPCPSDCPDPADVRLTMVEGINFLRDSFGCQ